MACAPRTARRRYCCRPGMRSPSFRAARPFPRALLAHRPNGVAKEPDRMPLPVKLGITLGRLNPEVWAPASVLADDLGYESVWMSDHLVIPARLDGTLDGREAKDKLSPQTPVFDPPAYLSYLA